MIAYYFLCGPGLAGPSTEMLVSYKTLACGLRRIFKHSSSSSLERAQRVVRNSHIQYVIRLAAEWKDGRRTCATFLF